MKSINILIVDQSHSMVDLLRPLLSQYNATFLTADNLQGALRSIIDDQPDIVLIDSSRNPQKDLDLCRAIRRMSALPVFIFSADDNPERIAAALDAGADDYIVKPVSSSLLIARMNKILRRTSSKMVKPLGKNP